MVREVPAVARRSCADMRRPRGLAGVAETTAKKAERPTRTRALPPPERDALAPPELMARSWPPRKPELDQRQRDMLGFATIALGVFLGFVLYGGWNGGRVGSGLTVALGWCVGRAKALAPVALVAGGGAMLARPAWPQMRPLRTGATCLAAAVMMALAAGTLGVSSGAALIAGESRGRRFPAAPRRRGGRGAVSGRAQARAERRRGHPRGVPAVRRGHPADGRLACGSAALGGSRLAGGARSLLERLRASRSPPRRAAAPRRPVVWSGLYASRRAPPATAYPT